VTELGDLGARAHLFDATGNDFGFCHLPQPVACGDLAALADAIFRVVGLIDDLPGDVIDVLVLVEPERPTVVD